MQKKIDSPHAWGRVSVSDADLRDGKAIAENSARWMETHEDAFYAMLGYVKRLQASGVRGRLRDRVAVWYMAHEADFESRGYRFANADWAGICRYMALADPSLVDDPIKFADSKIDCYGLLTVSYLGLE